MNFSPNFDIAAMAIESILPNNKVLYDDQGLPSVMVYIPKMSYADLGLGDSTETFPAFIVNGKEVDGVYISKYQNVMYNNRAYSLGGKDPRVSVNIDNAELYCANKGPGWHLMTRMEWMALAHWCKHNNCMPKGNNNYGKDISEESRYHAVPATYGAAGTADEGKILHVLTGSGPLTWSHDGTHEGIWDLNGNVYEWVRGMRNVYGELQVFVDNDGADSSVSQAANSGAWKCISAVDGSYITPDGNGTTSNAVRARFKNNNHWEWGIDTAADGSSGNKAHALSSVTLSADIGDAAKAMLQALGLYKSDESVGADNPGYFAWASSEAERVPCCGGSYASGASAGVFCCYGGHPRTGASSSVGFRSAFVKLPTD